MRNQEDLNLDMGFFCFLIIMKYQRNPSCDIVFMTLT